VITVPENCFNGIKTSCTGAEASNKFEWCYDNSISDNLVTAALSTFGLSDIQFPVDRGSFGL
jgi:hypothetical protein